MIPSHITHLAEVGSTNDWLLARADDLGDGHWVIADRQTAGRGRRGRAWSDGAGNLMASVLVREDGEVQQLSFVAAVAMREALVALVPALAGRIGLKWPNDLLLDGAKLAGILLERSGDALVIGFGVNLLQAPADSERPATSLAATGVAVPLPVAVLLALDAAFAGLRGLWTAEGFGPVRDRWLAAGSGIGGRIVARFGDQVLEGVFEGLEPDGALALRLDDGTLRPVHAGEVFAL